MILRLIDNHICAAVLFPYVRDVLVDPALEEVFQGADSGSNLNLITMAKPYKNDQTK